MKWPALLITAVCLTARAAFAQPDVSLTLTVKASQKGDGRPDQVAGDMQIQAWAPTQGQRCLYLPFNDENFRANLIATQFLKVTQPLEDSNYQNLGSRTKLEAKPGTELKRLKPYLFAVEGDNPELNLSFTSQLRPRRLFAVKDVFFDSYHPLLLEHCPQNDAEEKSLVFAAANLKQWEIKTPDGWQMVSAFNGKQSGAETRSFRSDRFSFALIQDYREESFELNGLKVQVYFRTPDFQELIETMKTALVSDMKWFGPYPFPQLAIIESSSLQPADMPGLVAINKPQQAAFASLQKDILNWAHWATVNLIALQWYGAAIKIAHEDDSWLQKGLVDFATLEALKYNQNRYDLFNGFKFDNLGLSLNYQQAQNLAAALLSRNSPDSQLVDSDFNTKQSGWEQHPYLYIKAAISLRHLNALAGEEKLTRFLRQFTQKNLFKTINPKSFHAEFSQLPSPFSPVKRQELQSTLTEWWTKKGWPDFALGKIDSKPISEGRWLHTISVNQLRDFKLPTTVEVQDERGIRYSALAYPTPEDSHTTVEMISNAPLKTVVIDPNEDFFDEDRLNNTNKFPSITFFPGSDTALHDDGYTLFWLPYPFRRPGQNLSLGIFAAMFRYIDRVLLARVEKEIQSGNIGYSVLQDTRFQKLNLTLELSATRTYEHYRTLGASLIRDPLQLSGLSLTMALTVRDKRIDGISKSDHQTVSLMPTLEYRNKKSLCELQSNAEYETTLGNSNAIQYQRSKGLASANCEMIKSINVVLRLFRGKVKYKGELPSNAYFDPQDITEARLRLDDKGLAKSTNIFAHAYDLLFPLILPLPGNTLILDRQLRGRLFFDNGENYSSHDNYRSAGLGMLLPLGGEFTGSGSLTVTKFNFFTILYSRVNKTINRRPRFIFDLTGDF